MIANVLKNREQTNKKNFLAPKKLHNAVNVSKIEAQKQEKDGKKKRNEKK